MLISSRGQYAIRILLDLAIYENGEAINVKTIAERQELSEKYMEQILSVLQKAMCAGLRVGLKVTLYELATPATASSQPRALSKHRKKAAQNLQKDRRHGLLVQLR